MLDYNILKDFIVDGDCVLVGVSGGADSMCLLNLLNDYKKVFNFDFYAAHINHGIRNDEALRDENFVKDFCEAKKIKFLSAKIDTLMHAKLFSKSIEQSARDLRYDMLYKLMKEIGANKLFVAHHKDDQAETVLMHIFRGCSLNGAKGMQKQNGVIYRPLLTVQRAEIEKYNKHNSVKCVEDSSNSDVKYVRNYIRNKIIPELKEIYPNIVNAVNEFAELSRIDDEFIDSTIDKNLVCCENDGVSIEAEYLKNNHYSVASRLIKIAFEKLNVFSDIEKKHFVEIINLVNKENGKKICLPHGVIAHKSYEKILLIKNNRPPEEQEFDFKVGETRINSSCCVVVEKVERDNLLNIKKPVLYADLDKIPKSAIWRHRKNGDVFKKFSSGEKLLSDFLTDKKVPKYIRDSLFVLATGREVLAVLGIEISEKIKITDKTKKCVKIFQTDECDSE